MLFSRDINRVSQVSISSIGFRTSFSQRFPENGTWVPKWLGFRVSNWFLAVSSVEKPAETKLQNYWCMPSEHDVTPAELHSFAQDPFQLLGRQFILHSHGDSTGLFYEVVGLRVSKERTRWYQTQFEGDVDCIEVDSEELTRMIEDSVLLEAWTAQNHRFDKDFTDWHILGQCNKMFVVVVEFP